MILVISGLILGAIVLWLVFLWVIKEFHLLFIGQESNPASLGDMASTTSALFSSLTFLIITYSLYVQKKGNDKVVEIQQKQVEVLKRREYLNALNNVAAIYHDRSVADSDNTRDKNKADQLLLELSKELDRIKRLL